MSNELELFSNGDYSIRILELDGEPWFVAKDVCAALGIKNVSDALERLDEDEKAQVSSSIVSTDTWHGSDPLVVSEAGLYSLTLPSRKPAAKAFRRWVTHEVLPSLRKTGQYAITDKAVVTTREKCEALQVLQYQARIDRELAKKGMYRNWQTGEVLPLPVVPVPEGLIPPLAKVVAKDPSLASQIARIQRRHEDKDGIYGRH